MLGHYRVIPCVIPHNLLEHLGARGTMGQGGLGEGNRTREEKKREGKRGKRGQATTTEERPCEQRDSRINPIFVHSAR